MSEHPAFEFSGFDWHCSGLFWAAGARREGRDEIISLAASTVHPLLKVWRHSAWAGLVSWACEVLCCFCADLLPMKFPVLFGCRR